MKLSLSILFITVFSFSLGFLRDLLLAKKFGGSQVSDLIFLSLVIPVFFENIMGIALRDAIIPALKTTAKKNICLYEKVVGTIGTVSLLAACIIFLIVVIFSDFFIKCIAPGWNPAQLSSGVPAFTIGSVMILLLSWSYFQTGLMNAEGRLVLPIWRSVFFNIGSVFALVFVPLNAEFILLGMISGLLVHLVWMQVIIGKRGLYSPFLLKLSDVFSIFSFKGDMGVFFPLLGATIALQVNVIAERFFASWLPIGNISFLSYAYRLTTVPLILFSFSYITLIYPAIVKQKLNDDMNAIHRSLLNGNKLILLIICPASIFLIRFSIPIVSILFERGEFGPLEAMSTGNIMAAYGLGLPAMALALFNGRVLLAINHGLTLFRISILAMVLTITFDALLCRIWGAVGLAAAASLGAIFQAIMLWHFACRAMKRPAKWLLLFRGLVSSCLIYYIFTFWHWTNILSLTIAVLLILAFFPIVMSLLGEKNFSPKLLLSLRHL